MIALAISAFALSLRLWKLDLPRIWFDEAFSYFLARASFSEMLELTRADTHPPLYYAILSGWMNFGDTVFYLRFPSAVVGTLACAVLYFAALRIVSRPAAVLAAMLFAASPLQIDWSQQLRGYAFLSLAGAICIWATVRLRDEIGLGRQTSGRRGPIALLIAAYAFGATTALYLHNLGALVLMSASVFILLSAFSGPRPDWVLLRYWAGANLLPVALWAFWIPSLLEQRRNLHLVGNATLSSDTFLGAIRSLIGLNDHVFRYPHLLLALLGLVVLVGFSRGNTDFRRFVFAFAFFPFLFLLVGAELGKPVFKARTILWACGPWALLIAQGVTALPRVPARVMAVASVAALAAINLSNFYSVAAASGHHWDEAAALVASKGAPNDVVRFLGRGDAYAFAFYYSRLESAPPLIMTTADGHAIGGLRLSDPNIPASSRVWLVGVQPISPDDATGVLENADGGGRLLLNAQLPKSVNVQLYGSRLP